MKQSGFRLWRAVSLQEFPDTPGPGAKQLGEYYKREKDQVAPTELAQSAAPLVGPEHIGKGSRELLDIPLGKANEVGSNKFRFKPGAVLYSRIRPNFMKATRASIAGVCSTEVYPLTPNEGVESEYLLELLLSPKFTQHTLSGVKGTGFPRVSHEHIAKFKACIPDAAGQRQYLSLATRLRKSQKVVSDRISELTAVKNSILSELH